MSRPQEGVGAERGVPRGPKGFLKYLRPPFTGDFLNIGASAKKILKSPRCARNRPRPHQNGDAKTVGAGDSVVFGEKNFATTEAN